jgi:hypothetical protein
VLDAADDPLSRRQTAAADIAHRRLQPVTGANSPVTGYGADGSLVWLRAAGPEAAIDLARALARERVLVRPPLGAVVPVLVPLTAATADVEALFSRTASAVERLTQPEGIAA